jgi:hypothetical protein
MRTLERLELVGIHPRPPFLLWDEAGWRQIPGEVVEVVKVKRGDGRDLYEGRIFDAASGAMVRPPPYRSTLKKPLRRWWELEAKVDPPEELL